ncbi:MupA/Atu3671 family FMN-dependent luciferase-like monooxygenase [Paenibacillus xylaniclasticus]|uniref:MupA/Atu3671 family FMN-dependent luciferase-like monooxygenase n=1 Tax=Paenibacillus xylaniclasticus TaxID=588083 RepID=UPI0013E09BEF|nr:MULTISPECIES: MupA/Atu3671 family FMN-dependent luciferase-like monooxygenase [Paenibacillus]GFN33010.1 siderophore biosynthesis protein [Paenibacillus curdlanolyticus]
MSLSFSLFFFSSDSEENERGKYASLLELAAEADERGFEAVWTPERHFHRFGGLFPNPSVLGAALAVRTERIGIRAGSISLPFHHPLRVAEDWSIVDNLSGGRVGLSVTYGWHSKEYVFAPGLHALHRDENREAMFDRLAQLQRIWRGEPINFPTSEGEQTIERFYPPPVQKELPIWVTTARSRDSWRRAGEIGANVLTALYAIDKSALKDHIAEYRQARRLNGHPSDGQVTVMLHTFLGDDLMEVREKVREPMLRYLSHHTELFDSAHIARELRVDPSRITEKHRRLIASAAFERYWNDSALFGTPDTCKAMADELQAMGVDEIACLIDFGVSERLMAESLTRIDRLRMHYAADSSEKEGSGIYG